MPIDAAAYAAQSDPDRNRHFRRLWDHPAPTIRRLNVEAGIELQHGHSRAAEHLARRAEELAAAPGGRR